MSLPDGGTSGVFRPETFLTEAKISFNSKLDSDSSLRIPLAMQRVKEEHSKLKVFVGQLNEKITNVLSKQEAEFLSAYRIHMYNVQKELQSLRQRVADAENALQRNDKVQKMEEEIGWYRKEALRLDQLNTDMSKTLRCHKERTAALEENETWLKSQVKACKRENALLRGELEAMRKKQGEDGYPPASPCTGKEEDSVQCGELLSSVMWINRNRRSSKEISRPGTVPVHRSVSRSHPKNLQRTRSRVAEQRRGTAPHGMVPRISEGVQEMAAESTEELKDHIHHLQMRLNGQQTMINRQRILIREAKMKEKRGLFDHGDLQDVFVQCVEDVHKQVEKRKWKSLASQKNARVGTRRRLDRAHIAGPNSRFIDDLAPYALRSRLPEDFTETDRLHIMEALLCRDEIRSLLYEAFFRPPPMSYTDVDTDVDVDVDVDHNHERSEEVHYDYDYGDDDDNNGPRHRATKPRR